MKNFLFVSAVAISIGFSSCFNPAPIAAPNVSANTDGSRNFVLIMHGEVCNGDANIMYVENSHETATIVVTVDVSWTENNQPRHENKTVTVPPNGKTPLGCDWNGTTFLRFEIMTSKYQ